MEPEKLDLATQQRLLKRDITDIHYLARRAFGGGLTRDFIALENANRDFKAFVAAKVTAPEIIGYIAQIITIRILTPETKKSGGFLQPVVALFSGGNLRATGQTIDDAKAVQGQYINLEVLVELMLED